MKPTIDVYHGSLSTITSEQSFLARLSSDLKARGVSALIFSNFFVNSRQIDFFVITDKCACHVELKNYSLPVLGKRNGTWKLRHPNGEISELDERENPYHQTLNGKFALSDKMRSMASKHGGLPRPQPQTKFYETIESVICIYPELLPGSEVPNDRKGLWKQKMMLSRARP